MERKIVTHQLKALGGLFGYAAAPDHGRETDPLVRRVATTVGAFVALDAALGAGGDVSGVHGALQIEMAKTKAARAAAADALARAESKLYDPPATTDPAMDSELRTWVRSLSPDRRAKAFENPHVVRALARFPAALPEAESARARYRAEVEQANPAAVREIERQRAALAWLDSAVGAIAGRLTRRRSRGSCRRRC